MSTYNQLIHTYRRKFMEEGLSPEVVKAFLFELCNEYSIDLYMEMDNEADERVSRRFLEGIERIYHNEPMNYVLGYSWFYGYRLNVDDSVLIPRPETEELVALVLSSYDEAFKGEKIRICDVGTGSGAIAIALKKEENSLEVYASDISEEALKTARRNAEENGCEITFLKGSMLEPYIENGIRVKILVSNPPYIKTVETVEASVYDFEPHVALFGGEDGLKFYREIFENMDKVLEPHGMAFFEIGYDQKERLSALAKQHFPDAEAEVFRDINGKDRMLRIRF